MTVADAHRRSNKEIHAEQAKWCYERRLDGWSIRRVSEESERHLGVRLAPTTVHKRCERVRKQLPMPAAESWRGLELDKLDDLETRMRAIIADEESSPSLRMAASDRLLKIQDRRARLLGLDAPERVAATTTVRYEVVGVDIGALT